MPITLLDAVDFTKIPALQFVVPVVSADPTGYEAGLIYNSTSKTLKYHNGTAWVTVDLANSVAGGDLTGTYPNPQIAAGVIVDADVAAANKDGAVATPSMRTLGMGAQQALAGNTPLNSVTAPTADVSLNSKKIINLLDPTAAQDAATKSYVDITAQGFDFKDAVRCVATANIVLSGTQGIDGVSVVAGNRVLVAGQTTPSQNGIYLVAAGAWTRTTDADATAEIVDGTLVPVAEGTANADSLYLCTAIGATPWTPATSSTWTKFSSITDLVAGAGLVKSGNTIDVVGDANLSVTADLVSVLSAPKWTTARSITLTGDVTGTVASVDGSANVSIATTVVSAGKRYAVDVGAGTSVVITHNLNTRDLSVSVYRTTTPWDLIQCGVEMTSVNTVTLKFATSVAASAYRVAILG